MPRQHENDPNVNRGEVHQISMQLGELRKAVEFMTDMWKRQEETATLGRKSLHDKFEHFRDDVGLQMAGLSIRVDRLVDTMTEVEPAVRSFKDEKLRQEGAKKLGANLWIATTTIAGVVGWGLHELVGYLKH